MELEESGSLNWILKGVLGGASAIRQRRGWKLRWGGDESTPCGQQGAQHMGRSALEGCDLLKNGDPEGFLTRQE